MWLTLGVCGLESERVVVEPKLKSLPMDTDLDLSLEMEPGPLVLPLTESLTVTFKLLDDEYLSDSCAGVVPEL